MIEEVRPHLCYPFNLSKFYQRRSHFTASYIKKGLTICETFFFTVIIFLTSWHHHRSAHAHSRVTHPATLHVIIVIPAAGELVDEERKA